nr:MAG TPA: hypothetical protein [Caudoviricetes sp.]
MRNLNIHLHDLRHMISGTLSNVLSPASVSIITALHLFESTLIRRVAAYYQGQALTIRIHTTTASLYSQYHYC